MNSPCFAWDKIEFCLSAKNKINLMTNSYIYGRKGIGNN